MKKMNAEEEKKNHEEIDIKDLLYALQYDKGL